MSDESPAQSEYIAAMLRRLNESQDSVALAMNSIKDELAELNASLSQSVTHQKASSDTLSKAVEAMSATRDEVRSLKEAQTSRTRDDDSGATSDQMATLIDAVKASAAEMRRIAEEGHSRNDRRSDELTRVQGDLNTRLGMIVNKINEGRHPGVGDTASLGDRLDRWLYKQTSTQQEVIRAMDRLVGDDGQLQSRESVSRYLADREEELVRAARVSRSRRRGFDMMLGGSPGRIASQLMGSIGNMARVGPIGGFAGLLLRGLVANDQWRAESERIAQQFEQSGAYGSDVVAAINRNLAAASIRRYTKEEMLATATALGRVGGMGADTARMFQISEYEDVHEDMATSIGGIVETFIKLDKATEAAAGTFAGFAATLKQDVGVELNTTAQRLVGIAAASQSVNISASQMAQAVVGSTSALRVMGDHTELVSGLYMGYAGILGDRRGIPRGGRRDLSGAWGEAQRSVQEALQGLMGLSDGWMAYMASQMGLMTGNPLGVLAHMRTGFRHAPGSGGQSDPNLMAGMLEQIGQIVSGVARTDDPGERAGIISRMFGIGIEGAFALEALSRDPRVHDLAAGGQSAEAIEHMENTLKEAMKTDSQKLSNMEILMRATKELIESLGSMLVMELVNGVATLAGELQFLGMWIKPPRGMSRGEVRDLRDMWRENQAEANRERRARDINRFKSSLAALGEGVVDIAGIEGLFPDVESMNPEAVRAAYQRRHAARQSTVSHLVRALRYGTPGAMEHGIGEFVRVATETGMTSDDLMRYLADSNELGWTSLQHAKWQAATLADENVARMMAPHYEEQLRDRLTTPNQVMSEKRVVEILLHILQTIQRANSGRGEGM